MARYVTTVQSARSREEAFAYLSDFSNALEWDPGVVEAERIDSGEITVGSEFRLVTEFMGRRTPLTYGVVELDAPRSVTFRAETGTLTSLDTITFEQQGSGASVTYDADLRLKGALKVADPLLKLAFRSIGDKARGGLREHLGAGHGR